MGPRRPVQNKERKIDVTVSTSIYGYIIWEGGGGRGASEELFMWPKSHGVPDNLLSVVEFQGENHSDQLMG